MPEKEGGIKINNLNRIEQENNTLLSHDLTQAAADATHYT
jgi:hypothetical protein